MAIAKPELSRTTLRYSAERLQHKNVDWVAAQLLAIDYSLT